MSVDQLSKGNDDGTSLGQSASDKVSFFGATPVVQQTAATAVSTASSTATTPYGFATSTQADAIVTAVNQLITNMAALGLDA